MRSNTILYDKKKTKDESEKLYGSKPCGFRPRENEAELKNIRFRKAMVVGNFDECVGTWAKRVREGKAILGLDQEAILWL